MIILFICQPVKTFIKCVSPTKTSLEVRSQSVKITRHLKIEKLKI